MAPVVSVATTFISSVLAMPLGKYTMASSGTEASSPPSRFKSGEMRPTDLRKST